VRRPSTSVRISSRNPAPLPGDDRLLNAGETLASPDLHEEFGALDPPRHQRREPIQTFPMLGIARREPAQLFEIAAQPGPGRIANLERRLRAPQHEIAPTVGVDR
jgi:hypothetical protein